MTADVRRGEQVAKIVAEAPESARGILRRAFDGDGGRQNAIRAMCLACVGFRREDVRDCTGYSCPLWAWRPYRSDVRRDPPKTASDAARGSRGDGQATPTPPGPLHGLRAAFGASAGAEATACEDEEQAEAGDAS